MIGYSYFLSKGVSWRKHFGSIIPLSMPHMLNDVTNVSAKEVLKRDRRAVFLRWESDFDKKEQTEWWHVIKSEPEELGTLNRKVRYMIRKASLVYDVKKCSRQFIAEYGYKPYKAAFARYETFEEMLSMSEFQKKINSMPEETEFWGVFEIETGNMVAFSENLVRDDACFYVTMWFEPASLKYFSSYILFHEMNKYYLNELGLKYVSDGARSISHVTGIHDFLISKFGFRKAYSNLNVIYKTWFYLFVKMLYPFRIAFKKFNWMPAHKINIILEQERIRLSCNYKG